MNINDAAQAAQRAVQSATKKVELGGHTFFITRLPLSLGQDLLTEILQGVGPALGTLMERFKLGAILEARAAGRPISEVLGAVDLSGLGEAVKKLVSALGKKELRSITEQVLAATTCATAGGKRVWEKGAPPLLDALGLTVRQGLELTWAAIVWNYSDFFSGPSAADLNLAEGPNSKE